MGTEIDGAVEFEEIFDLPLPDAPSGLSAKSPGRLLPAYALGAAPG